MFSVHTRKDGVFKFLQFEKHFRKEPFSWRISVDGRPNGRNKAAFSWRISMAAFSNFSGVVGRSGRSLGEREGETCKRWHVPTSRAHVWPNAPFLPLKFKGKRLTAGKRGKWKLLENMYLNENAWNVRPLKDARRIGHFGLGFRVSSLVPLFQNKSKCETFHLKMSSACSFIFMQIKVIFIRMLLHLDSVWNRGPRELGNGLLNNSSRCYIHRSSFAAVSRPEMQHLGVDWQHVAHFSNQWKSLKIKRKAK